VPRVEREEFVNIGVIVSCPARDFLIARFELDAARLRTLDPMLDIEEIRRHADSITAICNGGPEAGPIGRLSQRERFHWLAAPRSTVIQMSPVHPGRCERPEDVVEHLLTTMVRVGR
jgi:hypothetical protein